MKRKFKMEGYLSEKKEENWDSIRKNRAKNSTFENTIKVINQKNGATSFPTIQALQNYVVQFWSTHFRMTNVKKVLNEIDKPKQDTVNIHLKNLHLQP